jgi:hypothetical protein
MLNLAHDRRELLLDKLVSFLRYTLKSGLQEHILRQAARDILDIVEEIEK